MARPKSKQPTEVHIRILRAILKLEKDGVPTLIADIVNEIGLAGPTSLYSTLDRMRSMNLIEYVQKSRGRTKVVQVTRAGRTAAGQLGIPLLGTIPAGNLKEVLEQPKRFVEPQDLIPYKAGDFVLEVEGDSMAGDGIMPGDMVLLRPEVAVQQGEIVAVYVSSDFSATLKRIYVDAEKQLAVLRASNPSYRDQIVALHDIQIAGVYRGLFRTPIYRKDRKTVSGAQL
jgi:repressor LexA